MSDEIEIVAIFGKVSQVRDFSSLGITRIFIEIPVEDHVTAVALLHNKDVLITLAPPEMKGGRYGPRRKRAESEPKPEEQKGGPLSELAGQWCRLPAFQKWAKSAFPGIAKALPFDMRPEHVSRECILQVCEIRSRKDLDHDDKAAMRFQEMIRLPYMAHGAKEQASG